MLMLSCKIRCKASNVRRIISNVPSPIKRSSLGGDCRVNTFGCTSIICDILLQQERSSSSRTARQQCYHSSSSLSPIINGSSLPLHAYNQTNTYTKSNINRMRHKSIAATTATTIYDENDDNLEATLLNNAINSSDPRTVRRLQHIRNVGILAHVDAGKTTVTERMLALAGIVHRAGSVDSGDTVTDYLPAERERGITIQSAAIGFPWKWYNRAIVNSANAHLEDDRDENVCVHLIDTPGHVDFSVEVNRSVAVLDGAVLVVDAVAGVQAQTETVWRAITSPSMNNHRGVKKNEVVEEGEMNAHGNSSANHRYDQHAHEPLPCLAMINKMDKEGCNFAYAVQTLKFKLPGANPAPIQIPLFQIGTGAAASKQASAATTTLPTNIFALPTQSDRTGKSDVNLTLGKFVGVVDLIHMRAIIWPEVASAALSNVEDCVPTVIDLLDENTCSNDDENSSQVIQEAKTARNELFASLAEVDSTMEEYFLMEEQPSNEEILLALRRATLKREILPVLAGAALRGKGIEPLLDAVADLLPSPLDRMAPGLVRQEDAMGKSGGGWVDKRKSKNLKIDPDGDSEASTNASSTNMNHKIQLGHPLHPSTLALAFKVVHMKNRGGSGDGRVVFARVYSGKIASKDTLKVISPRVPGETPEKPRTERVGGMLELAGGRFDNLEDGVCESGDVCALVGLKSVVTGDTLLLASDLVASNGNRGKKKGKKKATNGSDGSNVNEIFDRNVGNVCLAGVASPKPVLTVRLEAESSEQQTKLSDALALLTVEDPSLQIQETESSTLLSGLGELHIEVVVDRLRREYGLEVRTGKPAVAYRETVQEVIETPGLVEYDRTIGATRLQAEVHLILEPMECPLGSGGEEYEASSCMVLSDPIVTIGTKARAFLGVNDESTEEELAQVNDVVRALILGCKGSLKRGSLGSYALANVQCHVVDIDSEGGLSYLNAMPGALRAAASFAISSSLAENKHSCSILEPTMSVEITLPGDMVGSVLSDLTSRRGTVGDVVMGEDTDGKAALGHAKALVRGEVPLVEILGYANSLRSITGGEGAFTAEYKGHSPCEDVVSR